MNYLLSAAFTILGTVMALLSKYPDYYWLMVSDLNVALALFVAWITDPNRR